MTDRGRSRGRGRGRGSGRGRGQTREDTDPPQLAPPVAAPIVAATPAAMVLAGATTTLQRHRREQRLPARFRDNGDEEFITIPEVSGDEEEEDVPLVGTRPRDSPLQTATDTAQSDPFATGGGAGRSAALDVHQLTTLNSSGGKVCKLCE
jgi:hypothetical protein